MTASASCDNMLLSFAPLLGAVCIRKEEVLSEERYQEDPNTWIVVAVLAITFVLLLVASFIPGQSAVRAKQRIGIIALPEAQQTAQPKAKQSD